MWKKIKDIQPVWGGECWISDGERVAFATYQLASSGYMWSWTGPHDIEKFTKWMYVEEYKPDIPK